MTAKELREKRAKLATEIRTLADKASKEGRDFTAEEKANWDKVNADYNAISASLAIAERAEAVEAEQRSAADAEARKAVTPDIGKPTPDEGRKAGSDGPTEEHRALALQAWFRHQMGKDLSERHVEACRVVGMKPSTRELAFNLFDTDRLTRMKAAFRAGHPNGAEQRALSAVVGATGGFTVPQTLVNALEIALLQFGGVLQVADILRTMSGERMTWPTANDTGNKGRRIAENTTVDTTKTVTFKGVTWDAYKYTSDAILVPTELLEDSILNLPAVLGRMLGERIGRILADELTIGTGAVQPNGLITAATLGKTAASQTAFTADEIIQLVHSVDPAYRVGAGFMMHDNVLLAGRLLKDGQGRYLWQSGMDSAQPDRLLGYPLTINQSMDSAVTTTKKTIAFGQLDKYKVRMVNQMRMYRLQERFRDSDQDAFLGFLRCDGNLLDAGTHPVKYLQQA